jgi:hypothetical protein
VPATKATKFADFVILSAEKAPQKRGFFAAEGPYVSLGLPRLPREILITGLLRVLPTAPRCSRIKRLPIIICSE